MKKIILVVFLTYQAIHAMAEKKPEKLYLRVIVHEKSRGFLDSLFREIMDMQETYKIKLQEKCLVSLKQAELWAYEFVHRDTHSQCFLMQGFVGDRGYLERVVKFLISDYSFKIMYHYKEATYERIGLSEVPFFIGGAAYLQDCEVKRGICSRLSAFSELPFVDEPACQDRLQDFKELPFARVLLPEFSTLETKKRALAGALCACSGVNKSKVVEQEVYEQVRSSGRTIKSGTTINCLLLPQDILQSGDESSCSSKTPARYTGHAPSPLCIPVRPPEDEQLIQVFSQQPPVD